MSIYPKSLCFFLIFVLCIFSHQVHSVEFPTLDTGGFSVNQALQSDLNADGILETVICIDAYEAVDPDCIPQVIDEVDPKDPYDDIVITPSNDPSNPDCDPIRTGAVFIYTDSLANKTAPSAGCTPATIDEGDPADPHDDVEIPGSDPLDSECDGRIIDLSMADMTYLGDYSGDHANSEVGHSCDVLDFNNDGFDDLIVGSLHNDWYETIENVYLIYGAPSLPTGRHQISDLADVKYTHYQHDTWKVASAGDFNGDGYDDFIASSDDFNVRAGVTYLIHGGASISGTFSLSSSSAVAFSGETFFEASGKNITGLGDFNGDGLDDIAISADESDRAGTYNSGSVYIVFGDPSLSGTFVLNNANIVVEGSGISKWYHELVGSSISGIGDYNNDGYNDLAIGSKISSVFVILGRDRPLGSSHVVPIEDIYTFEFGFPGAYYAGVGYAGDMDGDGLQNFVAAHDDSIHVVLGRASLSPSRDIDIASRSNRIYQSDIVGSSFGTSSIVGRFNNNNSPLFLSTDSHLFEVDRLPRISDGFELMIELDGP